MKKYINTAFIYAILAMVSGVFYREFTKILGFTGNTSLAFTHLHLFAMGTMMFLLVAIFVNITDLESQKQFKIFYVMYNIGLPFMVIMMYVRGVVQVLGIELSSGLNAAISGMAGIGHMVFGVSIILLFLALKKTNKTV